MLTSINSKFYATAIVLIISFSIGYGFLAAFLNQQSASILSTRDIAIIEKDFTTLKELFHESRFWEKVIFSQNNPEAEMQYGSLIEQARVLSNNLNKKKLNDTITSNLKQIIEHIDQYEKKFNQLIQLNNKQRLISTRMETNSRSMTSTVLMGNNPELLKQMFNLTHFLITYRSGRNLPKYQALKLVIDSVEKKLQEVETFDVRIPGYLNSFRELLSEDYNIELDITETNKTVENITNRIQAYFSNISIELELHFKRNIQEATEIKQYLQNIFLLFGLSGVFILLFVLSLFSKNVITPIKSIALVMQKVQQGNLGVRFINHAKIQDDIIQLGLSFNEMLDTVENNNQKILEYQKELERKIYEITRQKKESQELTEKLHQSQKMESIGTLAGGIAHDFNNILSSILGYTELALNTVEKGTEIEADLQQVFAGGNRATELVKQILAFARQSDEEIKPVKVSSITNEVLKFIRSSLPTTIDIQSDIQSNSLVMGNATQIHQVMINLFTNAAHAMASSGGVLGVGLHDISAENASGLSKIGLNKGDYLALIISDTGKGIEPDIINSIFEPYFTTKDVGEGTGMGLAMVHGIVENCGGKILVDSTPGKGTKFTIYLPVTKEEGATLAYDSAELFLGNGNILFVDDEISIVEMGQRVLEQLGYSVTTRTDSIEALELFRSEPHAFDLVVTDMTMPNMTGDKLAAELIKIRPDIPVILCTGYSKKVFEGAISLVGIKAFAYKPLVQVDLARTVRNVMAQTNCFD